MTEHSVLTPLICRWWQEAICEDVGPENTKHLDDETCYLLTLPNALKEAAPDTISHLSSCPICTERWASWLKASDLSAGTESEDCLLSYGLLEAAASLEKVEGITSNSVCGRFKLSIFPKQDDPDQAMITLEYLADCPEQLEGRRFIVLEGDGKIMLDGRLRNGRLARATKEFQKLNLDRWTIIEAQSQPEDLQI